MASSDEIRNLNIKIIGYGLLKCYYIKEEIFEEYNGVQDEGNQIKIEQYI